VLALLAAALAASTASPPPTVLETGMPWWERITVTVDDKGTQQSCRYETSFSAGGGEDCDEAMASTMPSAGKTSNGLYSKLTFERRFSPGRQLDSGKLQPGDTLIGRQVMFLTFDANGAVSGCHVVAVSGDAPTEYGCDQAKKEQFRVPAAAAPAERQAFMTILAYGHTEHIA
jgi:hypothetical protein